MIVHMIGNAHIDPIWLWRWQSGVDEALATFRSAADRCNEYPAFIFTRGEAWLYQQVERLDPDLFAEVKRLVGTGQWHITGGQYIQPDTNMPTGLGWQRQLEHGQRYFAREFGVRPTVGYNVDAFGHSGALPDIYAAQGYTCYVFGRPGEHQLTLPGQVFRWRGVQGGELVAFRLPNTAYNTRVDDLEAAILRSVRHADPALGHTMCFYGVGNHGGGPTRENITYILSHQDSFSDIELRFSTPAAFFAAIEPFRDRLPVVTGELQHTFPGCYSVMHDIKQRQRHGELHLAQAEAALAAFGAEDPAQPVLAARLADAWNDLLFTQFHDVASGTSVASAWPDVRRFQGRAHLAADEVILDTTRRWARHHLGHDSRQRIVALNPSPTAWDGYIETEPSFDFALWDGRWLSDSDDSVIPHQMIQAESPQMIHRVLFPLHIPAGGAAVVQMHHGEAPPAMAPTTLQIAPDQLKNDRLVVHLSATGISQLTLDGRPLLADGGMGLHLRVDNTDTWTFTTDRFTEPVAAQFRGAGWVVEEHGPLRGSVSQVGLLGQSRVRWTVLLYHDRPMLEHRLEVLFAEEYRLLQLRLAPIQPAHEWLSGLPQGLISRPMGATEWPVQGWSRLDLAGVYLGLTTSDIYSLSLDEAAWQWTLLRSPRLAWMGNGWGGGATSLATGRTEFTDQGAHTFTWRLHADTALTPAALAHDAATQVQRPIVFDEYRGMRRPTWGDILPVHLREGAPDT